MTSVTSIYQCDFEILADVPALGFYRFAATNQRRLSTAQRATSTEDDPVTRIRQKRCRILVVDDEDIFRASLIFKLQDLYNAIVEEAETGMIALEKLSEEHSFDVILMDISMPGMDGFEVSRVIREKGVSTRIVLMSGNAENQARALDLNATFLNKPLDDDGAIEKILLECKGSARERKRYD